MKTRKLFTKLSALLFVALLAIAVALCVAPQKNKAFAEAENGYYYKQISPEAKRFYDAIDAMNTQGLLKKGNAKYDLIANGTLTQTQLESYSTSSRVMAAFGAARDAYYLDHPEVFYIDFTRLSISVGTKNGEYVATLGNGRAETYYIENGFENETEVNAAITAFDTALTQIIKAADGKENDEAKIKAVNTALLEKVEYSFCSSVDGDGNTVYENGAPHIRNAYGALVNGKAVCEGYTRSFKCAMDKLGIKCVIVRGYASNDGGLEPHAWNYVNLDGSWYGVDTTWNDGAVSQTEYLLRGKTLMESEHIADGVISASDFEFNYPELNPNDYGFKVNGGLNVEVSYYKSETTEANLPLYKISKDGKNASQLQEEGLWLAYRMYYNVGENFLWSDWSSVCQITGGEDKDGYTEFKGINTFVMYVEFALIDYAPDKTPPFGGPAYIYESANLKEANFAVSSEVYGNEYFDTYYAPPYVRSTTPDANARSLEATKTYDITITYTENLTYKNGDNKVDIAVTTVTKTAMKYAEITGINFDPEKPDTVTFKFTPSPMYEHRDEVYSFVPVGLIGAGSKKAPMPVSYYITNDTVVCNKVYGDGRLFINSYGTPSLVSSGDLSTKGWKDDKGNFVSENQRSQLMLVATNTTEKQKEDMLGNITDKEHVNNSDIKSAQTFEIQLNICKNIVKIPDGSTMQVSFGFPEGYGPDDEGVTFKVYHFHRGEDGKIDYTKTEELECVITQFGLVVNVNNFSPFAVVAFKDTAVQSNYKSVHARAMGFGGSVKSDRADGSCACTVAENGSVTYTITPDNGYKVAQVLLNGKTFAANGNTVTLNYADLNNSNELEVHFVADSVAQEEQAQGIAYVYPSVTVKRETASTPTAPTTPDTPTDPEAPANGWPWYNYVLIAGAAVIAIGVIAVIIIAVKKRKN